jgi:hypothetical protein
LIWRPRGRWLARAGRRYESSLRVVASLLEIVRLGRMPPLREMVVGAAPVAAQDPAFSLGHIDLRLPDVWYLADLRGAAPQAPRGGTLTVPLDPSAGDVVGRSCGWGGCLRCEGWIEIKANGRLAARGCVRMVPAYAEMRRRGMTDGLTSDTARAPHRTACAAGAELVEAPLAPTAGSTGVSRPARVNASRWR